MKVITFEQVIEIHSEICREYHFQPVVLNRSLVESAVGAAFFQIEGLGYVHGNIPEIAAALCFKIVKNHAFSDGNKRTAAITTTIFLDLNGWNIKYSERQSNTKFQEIIESVASNDVSENELKQWVVNHAYQRQKDA